MEKNLGHATAYGYAKSKGYSGTEEEFAQLMADYASVGQSAAQSAEQAAASATSASGSAATAASAAQTATSKASEAVTAAGTAMTKASEASASADTASTAAQTATDKASEATTAATTATTKASEAVASATTATAAKTDAETARDAAAQSASEAAASAESIDPETLEHKAYGAYVVESASGAIASFADGADSIPMKDVLVHIEPVQAGSGDPSPDNVRPITGWTAAKVTRRGKNLLPYPFSETTETVAGITFTDLGNGKLKVNGTATGRAVFFYANHAFKPIPSGDYILSRNTTVSDVVIEIDGYNGNTWVKNIKTSGLTESSFSIDYDGYDRLDIFVYISAGQTVSNDTISLMIRLATETDATFTPYSGQTYDIEFPSEAGTVCGGTLDVTSGVLTVDRAILAYNTANMNSLEDYPGWRDAKVADIVGTGVNTSFPNVVTSVGFGVGINTATTSPVVFMTKYLYNNLTQSDWKALALDIQIVLPLATPITYQLPPQEITSLLGENNVWADTGNTEVEYRASTKMYIDKKITEAVSALS